MGRFLAWPSVIEIMLQPSSEGWKICISFECGGFGS